MLRTAINPSLEAAGKTPCFARSGAQNCDPAYIQMSGVHELTGMRNLRSSAPADYVKFTSSAPPS